MKVKLGSYTNRLRTTLFEDYMDKKYGISWLNDWPSDYSLFEKTLEWLDNKLQDFYNIFNWLWFDRRERKIKVHIDPWDTWSMDHTLAHIVVPMLKQLKETKHGAPFVDDEDVPEELKSTPKEDEWDIDDNHFKRWDWVMDEMIFAFESKLEDWEEKFYKYEDDPNEDLGIKLVWSDDEGYEQYQERITNGFRLFGKYYQALWD